MNVLLIGSGGREHALAVTIARSPMCDTLFAAPGNAGMADVAECVALNVDDHDAVIAFCRDKEIGLVVVGPEAPLVAGLVDDLDAAGIKAFGPTKEAARLEGSKAFTKEVCDRARIPTARYRRYDDPSAAKLYLSVIGTPIVVKADGLAAGKGVVVAETSAEAVAAVDACFEGGMEGGVVIEECMVGEEASFFALTDGKTVVPLATAQDHKRVGDGDTGPNTGGMGAYSPAPAMTPDLVARTMREIIEPTVKALAEKGITYRGVLYAGLMLTKDGPKLIEYNVRFGDPECQVLMARLNDDLLPLLFACAEGTLEATELSWRPETALTVVMASKGYPGSYEKRTEIANVEAAAAMADVTVTHAGTAMDGDRLLATGGRVLNVTALGKTVKAAQQRAYQAVDAIDWPNGFCRRDIGWQAIAREEAESGPETPQETQEETPAGASAAPVGDGDSRPEGDGKTTA
ncbi:phosphoribosylamine--glycine ligase [Rhodobium gokarnense]|uniref:Phosphoribosylamine--glycine ligase n=1 Tax=Rhodobium gokarnense TaxID=364296 RepID=A0ABT3HCQ1_9HYPH|nr:phosphoribosylamine--glycine ligase [Rhodobium gokarnense]MCW2308183.1 phosphoribosylamine--glycine ligase [Rhodobium gokarnense]